MGASYYPGVLYELEREFGVHPRYYQDPGGLDGERGLRL